MVYKNRGLVKNGCCVVQPPPPCVVPTLSGITFTNNGGTQSYTVTLTGSQIAVQWYYFIPGSDQFSFPRPFLDNPISVSGSQTTTLILTPPAYNGYTIFCSGRNPCSEDNTFFGTIRSGQYTIGCGPSPVITGITKSNCSPNSDPVYTTTCDYTLQYSNGTTFQWLYTTKDFNKPQLFVDGIHVSGSQTPTITLNTSTTIPSCSILSVYCVVTNSCGSTESNNILTLLSGCPQTS